MSDEHTTQEQTDLQREADRARPRTRMSVLGYITILFATAFLLLLWSYFMQQRANEQMISGLKESVSAMESLENLQAEKDALASQVKDLERELSDLKQEQSDAVYNSDHLTAQLHAMDWLREIQALYAKQSYRAARTMLAEFQRTDLPQYLPDQALHSYNSSDVLSPMEQYAKIVDALD